MNPLSVTRLREFALKLPPGPPVDEQLDVWLLTTRMTEDERESHSAILSADEKNRSKKFLFEADRDRFIAAHGGLRLILSAYSGVRETALAFQAGSHGKPSLLAPSLPLEFNVSHSGECVLIGITNKAACGVDIETFRTGRPELAIAERFFCAREIDWLKQTDGGFLRLWTSKEAIIKAVGRGLSIPLSDVDVTNVVNGTEQSIVLETPGIERRKIWLNELALVKGYAAAVAVEGQRHSVRVIADGGEEWL